MKEISIREKDCRVCGKPCTWMESRLAEMPAVDPPYNRCYIPIGVQYGHNNLETGELLKVCDKPSDRYRIIDTSVKDWNGTFVEATK